MALVLNSKKEFDYIVRKGAWKMKLHKLKILPEYYEKVLSKEKMFEIRKDDRNFKVGDVIDFLNMMVKSLLVEIAYILLLIN